MRVGPAAVVADAVEVHHLGFVGNGLAVDRGHPDRKISRQRLRIDAAGIVVRKIGEQSAAVGRLPPEQLVGEGGEFVRPEQLLGDEIIHARLLVDLRQLIVVAERIRIPADLYVHAEILLEVALADQNLPHQRFAVRHVQVGLDPHAADDLPSAFFHALLNLLEKVRIFLLHPFIGARRRHRELEVRILAHQIEHALERVAHDFDGLGPGPEPRHVNVRIADDANVELLQPGLERFQLRVSLFERGIEASLIAVDRAARNRSPSRRHRVAAGVRLFLLHRQR